MDVASYTYRVLQFHRGTGRCEGGYIKHWRDMYNTGRLCSLDNE